MGDLAATARALVAPGKGILAADESTGTIKKRFDSIGTESTDDLPPRLPGAALHHPDGLRVHQRRHPLRRDDPPARRRRHPAGAGPRAPGRHPRASRSTPAPSRSPSHPARRSPRDSTGCASASRSTPASAPASRSGGPRTRSRPGTPSQYCIDVNAHALARYAALCQEAGLVPIVEPEVLMDGDHPIERCEGVTAVGARRRCSGSCSSSGSQLEGMLLKPNMVLAGAECPVQAATRRGRGGDAALLPLDRARRGPRHRVPLGRPVATRRPPRTSTR